MTAPSPTVIDPTALKEWLHDGSEIALLDVREYGEFGESHPFYAVSLPYSRLELDVRRLVPRSTSRVVLYDDGGESDVAVRAASRLGDLGYEALHILRGGLSAWRAAGLATFAGVNLPSKTFGELAELAYHTPHISARELADRVARGDNLVILDGRPPAEFAKMSIPGGICCPNGELALRAESLAPDPATTIVINCAGRTRSIIGAQTLINMGIANPVLALENGTQGWFLEGLALERGASRRYADALVTGDLPRQRANALGLARRYGATIIAREQLRGWLSEPSRTTFLCDVRTAEEFARGSLPGAQHAPGGQLVQATDQYVGVRRARIVVFDGEMVRAPVIASWLVQLGWDASVLDVDVETLQTQPASAHINATHSDDPVIASAELATALTSGARLVDIRPSSSYRKCHVQGALWSIRPRLRELRIEPGERVVLIADEAGLAMLAARELRSVAGPDLAVAVHLEGPAAWAEAGLPTLASADVPADSECIDYLFFVHDRHDGNRAAALQYLAWETDLVSQIDSRERNEFRLA
ncbi:MAG: rhodanese-like domain-containing protein [Caldimonas sp.]